MEERGRSFVVAIAVFKVLKAVLAAAAAVGAFALIHRDLPELGERLADWLEVDRGRAVVESLLARLPGVSSSMLVGAGIGGIIYAALDLVEAYGLLRGRAWAEWLTVVATSLFIPFEVYELAREVTPLKVSALVVNVVIVAYLFVRRVQARRGQRQRFSLGAA